jgi:hypothetical protein
MKAVPHAMWRVAVVLSLALGVYASYASGQAVMNIQQATLTEADQKAPEISTEAT